MKKIIYISTLLGLLWTTSCDNMLDLSPVDKFADQTVWTDLALAETFVNNIYARIPHGFSNLMMAGITDEGVYNADFESWNVNRSLITPSSSMIFAENNWHGNRMRFMAWGNVFTSIRACNLFIENIEGKEFDDEEYQNRLLGEAYFLRAYHYHNLAFLYGGVPVIDKSYTMEDDHYAHRNSFAETIDFIVGDCDKAASLLPLNHTGDNMGRATKGASLALKSRVLLYAASDLYNNQSWTSGYSSPELVGYTSGDWNSRWQAAKDAAKAVMDLGVYQLHKEVPTAGDSIAQNYGEIFITKGTSEDIFIRYFLSTSTEDWHSYNPGLYHTPNGYHGWGSTTPTGQMVDAYAMNDGTPFSWSNPAHAANPYLNREPRFYATVLYEAAKWRERPADVKASDPEGRIQVGVWEKWDGTKKIEVAGLDTRKSPIEDWNGTWTGYYLRKFIDPTLDAQFQVQECPWRFIRYTEVLLNYAEACIELDQDDEAKIFINKIRTRAGLPAITETGDALLQQLRHERRLELAFEDHRFWDVRRWMIADQAYQDAKGVSVVYKLLPDNTTAETPTYTEIVAAQRAWNPRFYFLPIKMDEMNKNPNLVQNPLY